MPLGMIIDMAGDAFGDRVALVGAEADPITFRQWRELARRGAGWLRANEVSRVAYLGVNGPLLPVLLFSAALAGVPFTPLNFRLFTPQLTEQLDRLEDVLLVVDPVYAEPFASRTHILSDAWRETTGAARQIDGDDVPDEAAAVVLFTSGTTSRPKGVVLRHGNLLNYILQTVEFAGAEPSAAMLTCVPPYHIAAVGAVLSNLYAGRRVVYLPNFHPAAWLRLVRDEQISHAMVVPTMLSRLVDELGDEQADLPSLQALAYGGAKVSQRVLRKALEAFPGVEFVNAYGLTETSSTIALLGPEDHQLALESGDPQALRRLESVGRPVPGIEVDIRSADGTSLPAGERGLVWVRGSQVSGEYAEQGSVLDEDGWFPTADAGYLDEGGYLFIQGRTDDTIIRGGENIAPDEIESVLIQHPLVRDVAVVGTPDEEWGERIAAVVVPVHDALLTPEEVRIFVRQRLRGSRTPDDVVITDQLPYSPTGKLLRRELVSQLTARAANRPAVL